MHSPIVFCMCWFIVVQMFSVTFGLVVESSWHFVILADFDPICHVSIWRDFLKKKHADNMHNGYWNVRDITNVGRHVSEGGRWCSKCCDEHDRCNNGPLGSAITLLLWSSLRSVWKVLLKPIWPATSCLHHSSTKGCSSKTLAQSSSMRLRNVAMPSFPPIPWMVVADFASSVSGPVVRPTDETHTRCITNGYLQMKHDCERCNGIGMISRDSLNKSSLFRHFIPHAVWLD